MSIFCRQTRSYAEAQPSQALPSQPMVIMARSMCGLSHAQHPLCVTSSVVLHAVHTTDSLETNPCLWWVTVLICLTNDLMWCYCVLYLPLQNTQRKTATVCTTNHLSAKHNVVHVGLGCRSQFLKLWIVNNLILVQNQEILSVTLPEFDIRMLCM